MALLKNGYRRVQRNKKAAYISPKGKLLSPKQYKARIRLRGLPLPRINYFRFLDLNYRHSSEFAGMSRSQIARDPKFKQLYKEYKKFVVIDSEYSERMVRVYKSVNHIRKTDEEVMKSAEFKLLMWQLMSGDDSLHGLVHDALTQCELKQESDTWPPGDS